MTFAFPEELRPLVLEFPDELGGDGIRIRTPGHEDVDALAPAFLDPAVGGEAGLPPFDAGQIHAFIDHQLPQWRATGQLVPYAILDAATGEPLGGATLHHLDATRQVVELGYWLFVPARGRGVATRTVTTLVDWAFASGIYRAEAVVRIGNDASERVLERSGFIREGIKRRFLRYAGDRVDATLFSRLADDA